MLVLSRKPGQRIVIGEDVVITVVEFRGNVVRLGIEAPRSVPVYREEVLARDEESQAPLAMELVY
jgi:carbon storage regulator